MGRTKKKTVLKKKICLENLSLEDVFCITCRCIYLKPVTMPCGHTLCLECFKNMVDLTSYQCPTCRMRISNWLRKYKNDWSSMINEKLWQAMQIQYPVEIQKRFNDEDDGIEERIASQGFNRVQIQEGEIKKEFDNMIESFQEELKENELKNLELAKKLQEAEEINLQAKRAENERLTQDDVKLASAIQEQIQKELEQEEENNFRLALELQEKISSELKKPIVNSSIKTIKTSPKSNLPKKGPLDKIFTMLGIQPDQSSSCVIADTSTNLSVRDPCSSFTSMNPCTSLSVADSSNLSVIDPCSSSTSMNPCTSLSVADSSNLSVIDPCSSSTSMNPCTNLSVADLTTNSLFKDSGIFDDNDNLDICTCGRLKDNINSDIPPCQFCNDQIALLDALVTQKNDYLMAKKLQKSFCKENFEDYNLRKRSASPGNKVTKVRKRQQTLTEALYKK